MAMVKTIHNIITAAALMLLFVAPAATAEGETFLEASTVTVGHGSSASLAPLFFSVEQGLRDDAPTPAGFELEAAELRVEVDHAVSARAQVSEPFVPENTTQDHYTAARVSGLDNRGGYRFIVIPSKETQLHVRTTCASLSNSEDQQIQRVPLAANPNVRKPIDIEVSESIQWKDCGLSHLTFTGNYTLAFWEWDFDVRDAVGETTYTTGHFQHSALPGLPEESASVGQRREAWLFVQDGILDVQLAPGSPHFLYSGDSASVDSESGILLQDASGQIRLEDQSFDVGGQDVLLKGALAADLAPSSSGNLLVGLSGQVQGLQVGDEVVWVQSSAAPETSNSRVGALIALGMILLGIGALRLRESRIRPRAEFEKYVLVGGNVGSPPSTKKEVRGVGYWIMAFTAFNRGRHDRSLRLSQKALRCFPEHQEARSLQAAALGEVGRVDEALELADSVFDNLETRREQAELAYTMAAVCSRERRRGDVQKWLQRAYKADPSFTAKELEGGGFRWIRGEPWFQVMVPLTHKPLEAGMARPELS